MGYFKDVEVEIMSMAHDMGDDYGQDADTILIISRALEVPPEEVQRVLEGDADYDGQPTEMEEWLDFDPDC